MEGVILSFNREMGERFGITGALIYQELVRKQFYWEKQGKLVDGWFYEDQAIIGDWVLCRRETVNRAVKPIIDAGLLEKKAGYKPGTTVRTTWWRAPNPNCAFSEVNPKSLSIEVGSKSLSILNQKESNQYSVAKTKKTDSESPDPASNETPIARKEDSEPTEVRMFPSAILQRARSFFPGSRRDNNKKQLEKIEEVQKILSDETIIAGFKALGEQKVWHIDKPEKKEIPIILTSLLLKKSAQELADSLSIAAENAQRKQEAEAEKKKHGRMWGISWNQ